MTVSLFSFPSGIKAHIFVSWLHPFKEQKLVVVGDRKMAVFDDMEKENKLLLYPHSIEWKKHLPVPTKAEAEPVAFEPGAAARRAPPFSGMRRDAGDASDGAPGRSARPEGAPGCQAASKGAGAAADGAEAKAEGILFRP